VNDPHDAWLEWQRDHAEALAALQEAQRAYHRTVVERALASRRPSAVASQPPAADGQQPAADGSSSNAGPVTAVVNVQQALDAVDAARVKLDAVRARKPE
jgi:hypothetical protein